MRNVLITGGSRGIGAECVKLFCQRGDRVCFTYKDSKQQANLLCEQYDALALRCDLESYDDILRVLEISKNHFGESGVDILINNAAVSEIKLFSDITFDDWNRMISVNLTAPYLLCQGVLSDMIHKKNGRIINVSSMWGIVGASCEVHYSTAKAGLIGMTKALAKELGPSNITVNAVAPGVIDTEMNSHLSKEDLEMLTDEIPLMRIGSPREIAELIYFLSGDGAGYITGQVISSNGGMVV